MLKLFPTSRFRKDLKRIKKRNYNMDKLNEVIQLLLEEKTLPSKYCDHALLGDYMGFRECHINPDWLLIYAINKDKLILTASRTGTHADLFK